MAQYVLKTVPVEAVQYSGGPLAAQEMMFRLGDGCCITMTDNTHGALSYKGTTIDELSWVVKSDDGVSILTNEEFTARYIAG